MSQRTSIQQGARNALALWLSKELASENVGVEPRWVENDQRLVPKQITIIDEGPRQTEWLQPEALVVVPVGTDPVKVDATWSLGFITQPVQLDVWAQSDVELDDLIARLDESLNKGSRGLALQNVDPFEPGLRLFMSDGWAPGIVDFLFEEPVVLQAPSSVMEGEWRAMYRGRATAMLTQVGRSAKIARALLKARLRERDPIDTADPPDVTVILPTDT